MSSVKVFIEVVDRQTIHRIGWGSYMSEFVWHWRKGDHKIYTQRIDVAEQALKDGMLVMGVRIKPSCYRKWD